MPVRRARCAPVVMVAGPVVITLGRRAGPGAGRVRAGSGLPSACGCVRFVFFLHLCAFFVHEYVKTWQIMLPPLGARANVHAGAWLIVFCRALEVTACFGITQRTGRGEPSADWLAVVE